MKFDKLRHFARWEFDSPDELGSGDKMDEDFLIMLDNAREYAGIPFDITSGYRTKSHNKKVGGKDNSAHPRGHAGDIKASNSVDRYKIVAACLKVGFNRIGIMKKAVHADNDPSLPPNVLWHYYK